MLTEIEFMDKMSIILDKDQYVYTMVRIDKNWWYVYTISRNFKETPTWKMMDMEGAYEFYRERMESYGFKRFPVLIA